MAYEVGKPHRPYKHPRHVVPGAVTHGCLVTPGAAPYGKRSAK